MSNKFDVIIESALRRYQGVNFLIGDRVKFIDNLFTHDWAKTQPALKLERLKSILESGDNIRVSAVKAIRPATAQTGHFQDVDGFYVDVVREMAPGLFQTSEVHTLPDFLLELQDDYPNLAGDTPESQIRQDTSQIEPKEIETVDTDVAPYGTTARDGTDTGTAPDTDLPTKNVDISTTAPAKSYTANYLEG